MTAAFDGLARDVADWEAGEVAGALKARPEGKAEYRTASGIALKRVYTALDTADIPPEDIGLPGRYPFTRGPYPTMYRGRNWTMRQIAGFGTGADTNARFRYLLAQGQTGLSTDFDMPTLMGYDSDHPMSHGEVGREGVAVDTIDDMETLFDGIDLREISVSLTINPEGLRPERAVGHHPGRYPEGIHRAEGVDIPDPPVGALGARLHRMGRAQHAPLQPRQYLRLSHLRGGRDGVAGGRFRDGQRHRLYRGGYGGGAACR